MVIPSKEVDNAMDRSSQDYKCGNGIFNYYPSCLQRFANPKAFLACLAVSSISEGMVFTYIMGVMTSMERHFQMSSQQSGLLLTIGESVPVVTTMFTSFYGSRGNRPRWMAAGCFTIMLFCTIFFLGYLVVPVPKFSSTDLLEKEGNDAENSEDDDYGTFEIICNNQMQYSNSSTTNKMCTIDHSNSFVAYAILLSAFCLIDIGPSLMYGIGGPYMDDSIKKKDSPLYFTIASSIRTIGPFLGRMLSSACLHLYVNPQENTSVTENDPRWIGAWWLGFIVLAIIFCVFGNIFGLFPRVLKVKEIQYPEVILKEDTVEDIAKASSEENDVHVAKAKNIFSSIKRLLDTLKLPGKITVLREC